MSTAAFRLGFDKNTMSLPGGDIRCVCDLLIKVGMADETPAYATSQSPVQSGMCDTSHYTDDFRQGISYAHVAFNGEGLRDPSFAMPNRLWRLRHADGPLQFR
jgi:hypothetical protein